MKLITSFSLASACSMISLANAATPEPGDVYAAYFQSVGKVEDLDGDTVDYTNHRLTIGYYLSENLAVEGGFFKGDVGIGGQYGSAAYDANIEAKGISFGVKGEHHFNSLFQAYGRLGLLRWSSEIEGSVTLNATRSASFNESDSGAELYTGVGVSVTPGNWVISLDYEGYSLLEDRLNMIGAGIGYRF